MAIGIDGSRLGGYLISGKSKMGAKSEKVGDAAYGTYDDIVRGKWARGQQTADEIDRRNFDYKGDDISYETIGGKGGQIQNSNSAAYTYGKAMDLDLDSIVKDAGIERRLPGWGRNILSQGYDRIRAAHFQLRTGRCARTQSLIGRARRALALRCLVVFDARTSSYGCS